MHRLKYSSSLKRDPDVSIAIARLSAKVIRQWVSEAILHTVR